MKLSESKARVITAESTIRMIVPIISILFATVSILGNLTQSANKIATLEGNELFFYFIALVIFLSLPLLGLISYFISPSIVNKKNKIELLNVYPNVYSNIVNLCKELDLKKVPKCYVMNTIENYCYIFGRTSKDGNLIITSNLIEALTTEQLEIVLLHELAHIKHSDVGFMTWANTFMLIFRYWVMFFAASILISFFLSSGHAVQDIFSWLQKSILFSVGFLILPYISINSVSRIREDLADAEVLLYRPSQLIQSAIKEITLVSLGSSLLFEKRRIGLSTMLKSKIPKFIRKYTLDSHSSLTERIKNIEGKKHVYDQSKFWHTSLETAIYGGAISAYAVFFLFLGMYLLPIHSMINIDVYIAIYFSIPVVIILMISVYPLRYSAAEQITKVSGLSRNTMKDSIALLSCTGLKTSLIGIISFEFFSMLYEVVSTGSMPLLVYEIPVILLFQTLLIFLGHAIAIQLKIRKIPLSDK